MGIRKASRLLVHGWVYVLPGLMALNMAACGGSGVPADVLADSLPDSALDVIALDTADATADVTVEAEMVLIPPGSFWMGCNAAVDPDCNVNEAPLHEVTLAAYYIDKTEVTVAAYGKCVTAGSCTLPGFADIHCTWNAAGKEEHPVNCVKWSQSEAYCAWAGKRLPTEAEWEKAARGDDRRKYPWGNQGATCAYAVMKEGGFGCGTDSTLPVCSKSPIGDSPYDLCDMAGNVWEWMADWYDSAYYSSSPGTDPVGPVSGSERSIRGGCFINDSSVNFRTSVRDGTDPTYSFDMIGFRCAKTQ